MSVILGMLAAFLSGFLVVVVAPLLARLLGGVQGAAIVAQTYFSMSAKLYGRLLLVLREGGGLDLVNSSHDASIGLEKATLDGEDKHFEDPYNYMSRFYNVPFGIADEERGVVISPQIAELGELVRWAREDGIRVESDGRTYFQGVVPIDTSEHRLVHPQDARAIIQGSATADLADKIDDLMEVSQSRFNSTPTMQYLVWLGALGAGFGIVAIAYQLLQSGGGSLGRTIGIPTITGIWWTLGVVGA